MSNSGIRFLAALSTMAGVNIKENEVTKRISLFSSVFSLSGWKFDRYIRQKEIFKKLGLVVEYKAQNSRACLLAIENESKALSDLATLNEASLYRMAHYTLRDSAKIALETQTEVKSSTTIVSMFTFIDSAHNIFTEDEEEVVL